MVILDYDCLLINNNSFFMENYKVGIVGLGPIGQILAVHFRKAGCDVAICDIIEEKLKLIRENGISLEGQITGSAYFDKIYSSVNEILRSDPDIVFFAVKANFVSHILEPVGVIENKDMCVVSAQNGMDTEELFTPCFDASNILRMVVNFAGNLNTQNTAKVTFFNPPNYISSVDDTRPEIAQWIADVLNSVSMETKCVDSSVMKEMVWEKVILNCGLSALCASTGLKMREAMTFPATLELARQAVVEGAEVARAEGIKLKDNFVDFSMAYLGNAGYHFPSLAVDLMNERETEIEFINQKIVDYGKKHNIRADVNLSLTNIVKAITHKNALRKEE